MPSWNIPALVNKISEDVPAIKGLLTALFKWTDADTTDVPVGAKRLQAVAGGKQMQEYSGSAWASIGKLMHDVDMLDGKHASTAQTADTIPVRDANGTIPGNISGNAATATSAYGLAGDFVVPVANGGTGATTEAGARASLGADNASNINSGILGIAYGGTGSSQKNFVDLTENQNVGGTKTFSSEIKSTAWTLISGVMTGVSNADTTRGQESSKLLSVIYDKDGKRFSGIVGVAKTDGSRSLYFSMRNRADNGWIDGPMLKELADGTVQHLAKTPPAAANDTQIATTAWVTTFCETTKKYLKKTGDALTGKLQCTAKYTNADTTYTSDLLTFNSENDNYGNNVALGGGGNTIVGAGESYANQLSALAGVSAENTYICADGNIYLKTDCQTFANAKTITIDTAANMSGLATVTATKFSGPLTGNAATATKATQDSAGQQINTTYIKALSVSGKTITYTKGDGTTGTITTQDTNTTYANMKGATASAAGAAGLVPAPAKGKQGQYLRGDGAWATPTNTTYANFVKSGSSAAAGLVPKPSTTAGTTKYLREDCSWQVPPNTNTTYSVFGTTTNGLVPAPGRTNWDWYLAANGKWAAVTSAASDRRLKQNFKDVPENIIDIWGDVHWIQFLFKRDVSEEGEHARPHVGLVVQDVHEVYEKHGIDIKKYGITTHDLREAIPAKYDEDGNLISSPQEAVDRWMLNYNDALAFEALYLRKKIRLIEERLSRVESKVN